MRNLILFALLLTASVLVVIGCDGGPAGGDGDADTDADTDTDTDADTDSDGDTDSDSDSDSDSDADGDVDGDADGDSDGDAGGDAGSDGDCVASLSFTHDSSGGYTGAGTLDCELAAGTVTTTAPFGEPSTCSAEIDGAQEASLVAAAEAVGWNTLADSFLPPDNPSCCCDQYMFSLSVTLGDCDGGSQTYTTSWCYQSLDEALLPADLDAFREAYMGICDNVAESC